MDKSKTEEALNRNIESIYPSKEALEKVLFSGKKLAIYNGIDPTNPNIHLGNAVSLWKLRDFQKLGHKTILLVGDFTACIGDPSDKNSERPKLSEKQVLENAKKYKKQAEKILDFSSSKNPCKLEFNSKWLGKMKNKELLELAGCFTVQQIIERDLFQKRLKEKKPIGLHEFLYPLFQGYDSVAMNIDMEIGGRDQLFNMLAGRTLLEKYKKKEKFVITTTFLEGTDGRKMSKSWQNAINLTDSPKEQYGKIMSMKDELILDYFRAATRRSLSEIKEIERKIKAKKTNPRDVKASLAREVVALYYGEKKAREEEKEFNKVFKEKKLPSDILGIKIKGKSMKALDFLVETKLVNSKTEAQRMILQGAVKINNNLQKEWKKEIEIKKGMIVQVGKRRFVKIK
ncbi:tyrosine--tRNA ligase [Patescibacteria group bacterium]